MSDFICYALNRKQLLGISKQIYNYEEVIMRNSIRKIASLCLAMGMILSTLAMPALAAERAVHFHEYDNYVSSGVENTTPTYYDNVEHRYGTPHFFACDCGAIDDSTVTYRYEAHTAFGQGTLEYTITDKLTGATVDYVRYTCKQCHESFVREEH